MDARREQAPDFGGAERIGTAILFAVAVIICCASSTDASQADQFRNFTSDIWISSDGTLRVREILQVYFGRNRGGIWRRIPFGFYAFSATLDGHTEKFSISDPERRGWVRLGTKPKRVPAGAHTYGISYRTEPEVTFDGAAARFVWSTGVHPLPFQSVIVRFHLPPCALLHKLELDTNTERIKQQTATEEHDLANTIIIRTTKALSPEAGLHVALNYQNRKRCALG